MSDIIRILPENVANQIAAGEVVQRPASAVKELMENAIDAGGTDIQLIIRDAGKTLIQVVDNGCGMSEADARLCFERHATSKIKEAGDLFKIQTFGFRGEAMASIAAVAQVELKTKRTEDPMGSQVRIEGSAFKEQSPCSTGNGTSIAVKNLFFNVPARRNFLKSDATELSYILEEFHRLALVNPMVAFSYYNNNKLMARFEKSNMRQRLNAIFGANYSERLIPVGEQTSFVDITGYIGKPDAARKTRGEQYFFVNGRYIRHPYLAHSVEKAYAELIPENTYPPYFIFLTLDPAQIDINIHPTKTEVKFQDEKTLYSIMRAAIRKSFGSYSVIPSLDFETERPFDFRDDDPARPVIVPGVKIDPTYNPFDRTRVSGNGSFSTRPADPNLKHWENLYNTEKLRIPVPESPEIIGNLIPSDEQKSSSVFVMFNPHYFITTVKSGLMFVNVAHARERIYYERYLENSGRNPVSGQRLLFPETLMLSPQDSELLTDILADIRMLGFDIEAFGKDTWVVNALPEDAGQSSASDLVDQVLDGYRKNMMDHPGERRVNLAHSMARSIAGRKLKILQPEEMQALADELFATSVPDTSPSGRKVVYIMPHDEIEKKFK